MRLVKVSAKAMGCRGNCLVYSPAKEATLGNDVAIITSALSSSSLQEPELFAPQESMDMNPEKGQPLTIEANLIPV